MSGERARTYRDKPATASGPGRVLIAVYGIFALSATARGLEQIAREFSHAPLAYVLSTVAGVIYILATIGLARRGPVARKLAWTAVSIELLGVLAIGTFTLLAPGFFGDATVWSDYGRGYGYIPLVLPFVGLWWLSRTRAS